METSNPRLSNGCNKFRAPEITEKKKSRGEQAARNTPTEGVEPGAREGCCIQSGMNEANRVYASNNF